MKEQLLLTYKVIRNFLFTILNRKFLVFLFFLALSGVFWMLMALNETYESEYKVPVTLVNIPRDVVITTEMEDTVRVTIRDIGFTLAAYQYWNRIRPLVVSFKSYTAKDNGRGQIPQGDLQKQFYQSLFNSSKIVSVKPERLEFYYNPGISKKVPVRLYGSIQPAKNYYIARIHVAPQSVTVYADKSLLDSIEYITTDYLRILNFQDTVEQSASLKTIRGAKIVPSQVQVTLCPDILTEESVEVPIVATNVPEGKVLRTFPSRVKVNFVVGASQFRKVKSNQFRVEVDYRELTGTMEDTCHIYLRQMPSIVRSAKLEFDKVDYLIEQ